MVSVITAASTVQSANPEESADVAMVVLHRSLSLTGAVAQLAFDLVIIGLCVELLVGTAKTIVSIAGRMAGK